MLTDRALPARDIQDTIIKSGGEWVRQVTLFDVYLGDGVPKDKKSVAFAVTLQHPGRTLKDEEVVQTMDSIVKALKQTLDIELRG
jgi:phenylalanyl-tRNA synthetase beta chain